MFSVFRYPNDAEGEYKNLVSFVGITADDLQRLANVRPLFEKHAYKIIDPFYDHIGNIPHLVQIIQSHSTIDRLKRTLYLHNNLNILIKYISEKWEHQY
jgi:heme-based aerotactic transducer